MQPLVMLYSVWPVNCLLKFESLVLHVTAEILNHYSLVGERKGYKILNSTPT